ncbi:MAG: hypothetical protein ICV85_08205, partial [Tolypothrix sp. T3-bin4]|nr:hypothetical protein [Tolypothrix sp. T3-bin4]
LGRILSDVISAGAETCANPDFDNRSAAMMLPPVMAELSRKRRRVAFP